jgi:hypothetical protein
MFAAGERLPIRRSVDDGRVYDDALRRLYGLNVRRRWRDFTDALLIPP